MPAPAPAPLRLPSHPPLQVAALLAEMEVAGLGFDPWLLLRAGEEAKAQMARLEARAAELAGRPLNLASPSQLANVLYGVLRVGGVGERGGVLKQQGDGCVEEIGVRVYVCSLSSARDAPCL